MHYGQSSIAQQPAGFDPRAWLCWVLSGMAISTTARNPLYSLLLLAAAQAAQAACHLPGTSTLPLWRLGFAVVGLSALFNALSAHVGKTVLVVLPPSLPLVGGPITLEALAYGAANGLSLLALLAFFSALNSCVPAHELVRLTPRAFHSLGVVLLIAATYGPQTSRHLQQIREAQAVRGHRLRGWRDWRPILLPLLIGGLERSMGLAEAMVARGYGATTNAGPSTTTQAMLVLSLLALLSGWLLTIFGSSPGLPLLALGAGLLAILLWRLRRSTHHTVYRPRHWHWPDTALVLASLTALLATRLPLPWLDQQTLFFDPYPRLTAPGFDPLLGLALALLATPALLGGRHHTTPPIAASHEP